MSRQKKDHEECRRGVCILCLRKADRPLSTGYKEFIINFVLPTFSEISSDLADGICFNCRKDVSAYRKEENAKGPFEVNYNMISFAEQIRNRHPATRNNPDCDCRLCQIRRETPFTKKKLQQEKEQQETLAPVIQLCRFCLSEYGVGKPHNCSRESRVRNADAFLSPASKKCLTNKFLKSEIESSTTAMELKFSTGGRPQIMNIVKPGRGRAPPKGRGRGRSQLQGEVEGQVAPSCNLEPELPVAPLPHSTFLEIQKDLSLSNRQTLAVGQSIRQSTDNRYAIERNLKKAIEDRSNTLLRYFEIQELDFYKKHSVTKVNIPLKKPAIILKNPAEFIQDIMRMRNIEEQPFIKIGIDGGRKFLKICLNLLSESNTMYKSRYMESGVKGLFIIAIVYDVPETYGNVKALLDVLAVETIHFKLAADLKLCNVIVGLQSHSCKYPCTWCEAPEPFKEEGDLRTFGSIKRHAKQFADDGGDLKYAQNYFSCTDKPLIEGDSDTTLLEAIPPPELHLMLGATNKIFEELDQQWGENKAHKWAQHYNITKKDCHGSSYDGNKCKMILERSSMLMEELPQDLRKFAEALMAFDEVRKACFSMDLHPNYKEYIDNFKSTYLKLGIPLTPKVHCIITHVPQFCEVTGLGLGKFSEQASESVHYDFLKVWEHYKVPEENVNFSHKLLRAVVKYNSLHI